MLRERRNGAGDAVGLSSVLSSHRATDLLRALKPFIYTFNKISGVSAPAREMKLSKICCVLWRTHGAGVTRTREKNQATAEKWTKSGEDEEGAMYMSCRCRQSSDSRSVSALWGLPWRQDGKTLEIIVPANSDNKPVRSSSKSASRILSRKLL